MNVYLIRFGGHYMPGEMIVIDETLRKAFNQAKKKIDAMGLSDRNGDLAMDDIQQLDVSKRDVILIDDGNY
jgi:hypothetical protein